MQGWNFSIFPERASTLAGNLVSAADQEAKLRLVAETAQEVWGRPAVATRRRA